MKVKNLLQEWEQTQTQYYNSFDRDELEELMAEWYGWNEEMPDKKQSNDSIIEELVNDELEYRKQDSIKELKETLDHTKSLLFNLKTKTK